MDPVVDSLDAILRAVLGLPLLAAAFAASAVVALVAAPLAALAIRSACAHAKGGR